jgi:hypothetical protein
MTTYNQATASAVSPEAYAAAIKPVASPFAESSITAEMYAAATRPVGTAAQYEPASSYASAPTYEPAAYVASASPAGPRITGSPAFVEATRQALAKLGPKAKARVSAHLSEIVEDANSYTHAGAYSRGSGMAATRGVWGADATHYAAQIAHEAGHAANPGYGQEAEATASQAEADALREMGHWWSAGAAEKHGRTTKHHVGWLAEQLSRILKV